MMQTPLTINTNLYKPIRLNGYKKHTTYIDELRDSAQDKILFTIELKNICPESFFKHKFEKNLCIYCGIGKDLKVTDKYYKKYKNIVLIDWVTPVFRKTEPIRSVINVKIEKTPLDKNINTKLMNKFIQLYGIIPIRSTVAYLFELAATISSIGFADLSEKIKANSEIHKITGINKLVEWSLVNKDSRPWIKQHLFYLTV